MARAEGAAVEATAIPTAGASGQSLPAEAVAIASHDLKNFVTTVNSLLAEGRTEEDRARLLQIAQRATARMERLIGGLLDNARIEALRPPTVEPRAMEVAALVREVCEAFAAQAARESKTIDFDVAGELPLVRAEGERLREMLTNLVGNAMKRTPGGGRLRVLAERAGAEIRLSVTDNVVEAHGGRTSLLTVPVADGNGGALPSDGAAGLG
jgi:signal transduction histidine kinase